jgi:hypothetical protein
MESWKQKFGHATRRPMSGISWFVTIHAQIISNAMNFGGDCVPLARERVRVVTTPNPFSRGELSTPCPLGRAAVVPADACWSASSRFGDDEMRPGQEEDCSIMDRSNCLLILSTFRRISSSTPSASWCQASRPPAVFSMTFRHLSRPR